MKQAMKVILPILLAIVILGCMIWYLFVYDRTFTRDVLLYEARCFERSGKHTIAAWFYDMAYFQANQDEDVAIELAQQYKNSGNYSKAEYTLSNAIADGGTAKLYMALCKTYVEQDKLLDAVEMLNNIADPAVKAELDALRPAAPTSDPAPGFYSEYIPVSITADTGVLYVTSDGTYPSTAAAPFEGSITLPAGETLLYALAVSEDGLVSPLSIFGYTVGGVIEKVSFADPAVEANIRGLLEVDEDEIIYTNDLWTITSFTMPEDASTYADLGLLPYLSSLTIQNGVAGELGNIVDLVNLEELTLVDCRPSDEEMSIIAGLPSLQKLTLDDCALSSIDALSIASNLTYLNLNNNNIRNITVLGSLAALQELYLKNNAVTDLSALSALNKLSTLDVSYNTVSSSASICVINSLTWLDISNNTITSLDGLGNLTGLTHLSAAYNGLTEVTQLASCAALTELDISNNSISDITCLAPLTALETFNFSYNQISELPAWGKECALISINGSNNLISSLDALSGMINLNKVLMDYNTEITSVDCLSNCPNLYLVDIFGTQVTDATSLTDQSIIVNYDPSSLFG